MGDVYFKVVQCIKGLKALPEMGKEGVWMSEAENVGGRRASMKERHRERQTESALGTKERHHASCRCLELSRLSRCYKDLENSDRQLLYPVTHENLVIWTPDTHKGACLSRLEQETTGELASGYLGSVPPPKCSPMCCHSDSEVSHWRCTCVSIHLLVTFQWSAESQALVKGALDGQQIRGSILNMGYRGD